MLWRWWGAGTCLKLSCRWLLAAGERSALTAEGRRPGISGTNGSLCVAEFGCLNGLNPGWMVAAGGCGPSLDQRLMRCQKARWWGGCRIEALEQALTSTIFGGFGVCGLPQGAAQQSTALVGAHLHHPATGFAMHQLSCQLHGGPLSPGWDPYVEARPTALPSDSDAMEAELVPSLTALVQDADQWREVLVLLPLLVALEAVLSADNAIALAAISRRLHDPDRQRQALNIGLLLALVLRLGLILAARWVLHAWPLQLLASGYLLWLCGNHLVSLLNQENEAGDDEDGQGKDSSLMGASLLSVVATLAFTDLAFSLDSVAAAVAVTDRLPLVMAGGVIGVLALRLTAGLFIRWLEVFRHLETAGYLAVGLVGIRLLIRLAFPALVLPEWSLLIIVALLFFWGFSARVVEAVPEVVEVVEPRNGADGG